MVLLTFNVAIWEEPYIIFCGVLYVFLVCLTFGIRLAKYTYQLIVKTKRTSGIYEQFSIQSIVRNGVSDLEMNPPKSAHHGAQTGIKLPVCLFGWDFKLALQ